MESMVEGRARNRDISYIYLQRHPELVALEQGIPMRQFYYNVQLRNLDCEYKLLTKITETREHASLLLENTPELRSQNRYPDVLPYKDTLVLLSNGAYINASFIDGVTQGSEGQFIVTQGPLSRTVEKFWDMIYEQGVSLVVMTCNYFESNQSKCDRYFPQTESLELDNFTIKLLKKKKPYPGLAVRRFSLTKNEEGGATKTVLHVQYKTWQDHTCPSIDEEFDALNYILYLMKKHSSMRRKVAVHCSAGIGRSGTLMALYNIVAGLEKQLLYESAGAQVEPKLSVFGVVRRLREQRWGLVQAKEQYRFIYEFMEYWITSFLTQQDEETAPEDEAMAE